MENVKIIYFSKSTAAYNLKVGRCIKTNDLMKLHEYQMSCHYLTFAESHSVFKHKFYFSQNLFGYLTQNVM